MYNYAKYIVGANFVPPLHLFARCKKKKPLSKCDQIFAQKSRLDPKKYDCIASKGDGLKTNNRTSDLVRLSFFHLFTHHRANHLVLFGWLPVAPKTACTVQPLDNSCERILWTNGYLFQKVSQNTLPLFALFVVAKIA